MKYAIAALVFLGLFTGHCLPDSLAYGSQGDAGLRVKQLEQEIRTEESALIRLKKNYAVIQKEKDLAADYPRQRSAIITRALNQVLKEKQRLQNLNEFQRQQQEKIRLGQEQRARLLKEKERLSQEQRQKQKALKRKREALRRRLTQEQLKSTTHPFSKKQFPAPKTVHPKKQKYAGPG